MTLDLVLVFIYSFHYKMKIIYNIYIIYIFW